MMTDLLIQVIQNSILISFVFLGIQLLRPLLKQYRHSAFRWIWIVCAMFLLFPFELKIPQLTQEIKIESQAAETIVEDVKNEIVYFEESLDMDETENTNGMNEPDELLSSFVAAMSFADAASLLWAAVALGLFIFQLFTYFWFQRLLLMTATEIDDSKVPIVHSELVDSPLLTGLFHPVIALPSSVLNHPHLDVMIHHELTHCQSYDLIVKFLMMSARCMHWFNPLIYLIEKQCANDLELACDETMLEDANELERQIYAQTLLDMVCKTRFSKAAFTTQFSSDDFKSRIISLFDTARIRKGTLLCFSVALFSFAVSALFSFQLISAEKSYQIYHRNQNKLYAVIYNDDAIDLFDLIPNLEYRHKIESKSEFQVSFNDEIYAIALEDSRVIFTKGKDIQTSAVIDDAQLVAQFKMILKDSDVFESALLTGRPEEAVFQEFGYGALLDQVRKTEGVQRVSFYDYTVEIDSTEVHTEYYYYDRLLNFYCTNHEIDYSQNNKNKTGYLDIAIAFWDVSRPYIELKFTSFEGRDYPMVLSLEKMVLLDNGTSAEASDVLVELSAELQKSILDYAVRCWNESVYVHQILGVWQEQFEAVMNGEKEWKDIQYASDILLSDEHIVSTE